MGEDGILEMGDGDRHGFCLSLSKGAMGGARLRSGICGEAVTSFRLGRGLGFTVGDWGAEGASLSWEVKFKVGGINKKLPINQFSVPQPTRRVEG